MTFGLLSRGSKSCFSASQPAAPPQGTTCTASPLENRMRHQPGLSDHCANAALRNHRAALQQHLRRHQLAVFAAAGNGATPAGAPGGSAEAVAVKPPSPAPPPSGRQVGLLTVVPDGGSSPLGPSWQEIMTHLSDRLSWIDPVIRMQVRTESQLLADPDFTAAAGEADILLAIGIHSDAAVAQLADAARPEAALLAFESARALQTASRIQGYRIEDAPATQQLLEKLPFGPLKKAAATATAVKTFWGRESSDDLLFMFLTVINAFYAEVPLLQNMRAKGVGTIVRMVQKCGPQIFACVNDPDCKAALDCLQSCDPTDQVAQYKCIVSYESQLLEDFSLCILEKNNCLGVSASIPSRPEVLPMDSFQRQALTHDSAERIFIGWLGKEQWSWRVVAGQNAAYDQFSNQYQIYYKANARGVMWYDPVFQVEKFDGTKAWRRRHYRVRRGQVPGTFNLSVLDNGVTSREFWRIVDCPDDLSWALFYYAGAATAAGQSYTGAVLVTRDGTWPGEEHSGRLTAAFDRAGIKEWEMYRVDNSGSDAGDPPPLDLPAIAKMPDVEEFAWS